jgi:peptide/nickel transport system substrate-binding protein
VDIITGVPIELVSKLEENPDITVHSYLRPNVRHIQMNTERFPFTDKKTRLAVAYALNREEIKGSVNDSIKPVFGLISEAMISHDPETESELAGTYSHDLEKAKELLAEAGWEDTDDDGLLDKDGKPFSFTFAINNSNNIDKKAGPIMQSQLKKVGIDAQIREYDGKYIRELIETADFDMVLRNWTWLDPGGVWPAGLHSGGRLAPWSDPEVDELMDAAIITADPAERAVNWGKVSRRVWQDVPIVPMWSDRYYLATQSNIKGLKMSVSGALYFHDMVVEEE